jgi:lysophospholipase L1-like esterase
MNGGRSAAALLILGLTLGVLLIEFGLRLFAPQPLAAVKRDPHLGWLHKPGGRFRHATSEVDIPVRYSTAGLRDVEHSIRKPEGCFRIAFLGDSFTEGREVHLEETFVRRVESMLNATASPGTSYETINFGVAGYGTAQYLIVLRRTALPYDPDLVVVGFCLNDPGDNLRSRLMTLEDGKLVLAPPRDLSFAGQMSARAKSFLAHHSHLWSLVSIRLERLLGRVRGAPPSIVNLPDPGAFGLPPETLSLYFQNFAKEYGPMMQRAWDLVLAILREIHAECESRGIPVVLFLIPNGQQLHPEQWHDVIRHYAADPEEYDTQKPNRLLAEFCREEGIHFLDLYPIFEAAADRGESFYYPLAAHWNPHGHELAARALSDYIRAEGLIPCASE